MSCPKRGREKLFYECILLLENVLHTNYSVEPIFLINYLLFSFSIRIIWTMNFLIPVSVFKIIWPMRFNMLHEYIIHMYVCVYRTIWTLSLNVCLRILNHWDHEF